MASGLKVYCLFQRRSPGLSLSGEHLRLVKTNCVLCVVRLSHYITGKQQLSYDCCRSFSVPFWKGLYCLKIDVMVPFNYFGSSLLKASLSYAPDSLVTSGD